MTGVETAAIKDTFLSIMKELGREEDCLEIMPVTGGVTNMSYSVISNAGHYILRVPGRGTNEYINRHDEIRNMKSMAGADFLADVLYANEETGIILSHFIENNIPMSLEYVRDEKALDLIMQSLVDLHKSSYIFQNEFDYHENISYYVEVLSHTKKKYPAKFEEHIAEFESALDYLYEHFPKKFVPCHGDTKLNNFLRVGDKIYMIDWEYSGLQDEYYDIVNMVMTNYMTDEEEQLVLDSYSRCSGEEIEYERYLLNKIATDYMWIYWHLIKLFQGEMVEYNENSWNKRFNRAHANLNKWRNEYK